MSPPDDFLWFLADARWVLGRIGNGFGDGGDCFGNGYGYGIGDCYGDGDGYKY